LDTKLRAGSSRTSLRRSLVASSRMRMLAYAIPYGPRTQPAAKHNFARVFLIQQKRATDVQIRRNWILTSTLSTYLSAMQETMQPHTRSFTFGISGVCATRALSSKENSEISRKRLTISNKMRIEMRDVRKEDIFSIFLSSSKSSFKAYEYLH